MKRKLLAAVAVMTLALAPARNAYAIFGSGDIVYDPANHAQNVLTAARTLIQINNQVRQLANEAQMLINQTRNLTRLPTSIAADLQASLRQMDLLIQNARGLAYQVAVINSEYRRLFPDRYTSAIPTSRISQDAQEAWALAREGFKHSLEVQAEVVGQVRTDALVLDRLVAESQSAAGNLQALQAGNQLTALERAHDCRPGAGSGALCAFPWRSFRLHAAMTMKNPSKARQAQVRVARSGRPRGAARTKSALA